MGIQDVKETLDFLLQFAEDSENERLPTNYHFIADYYRINAELPLETRERKVVLNVLGSYPDVQVRLRIDEISEEYRTVITRDAFKFLTEWAYRYGSKGRPIEEMENPDTGEPQDDTDEVVEKLNQKTQDTKLTVNDASLALDLANLVWERYEEESDTIFESNSYKQVTEILEEVQDFVELKRDDIDWDMMAGTFDDIENQSQQNIMKKSGKREVLRELREFEGESIEAFLEQYSL